MGAIQLDVLQNGIVSRDVTLVLGLISWQVLPSAAVPRVGSLAGYCSIGIPQQRHEQNQEKGTMRLSAACRALQPPHGLAARLGATLAIIDATKSPRPRAFAGSGGRAFNASHSSRLMNLCDGDGTV